MKILFYSTEQNHDSGSTHGAIMDVALPDSVEYFSSLSSLAARLRQPRFGNGSEILVLSVCNQKELLDLKAMENTFKDVPLILILPDHEEKTVSTGHSMFPRFLWFKDSHVKELKTVLSKMVLRRTRASKPGFSPVNGQIGELDERA
jgi:hypothetical protein